MAELKELYNKDCIPQLMQEFGYKNVMEVPKLDKIVLNMGWVKLYKIQRLLTLQSMNLQLFPGKRL